MSDMEDIIDEALKDRVFAGQELNLRQRLEIAKHLNGALAAHGYGELEPTLTYSGNVRGARDGHAPDGWDIKDWHRAATADSGVSHSRHGRLNVIQCAWCPQAFAAPTAAEAMEQFHKHESDMQDETQDGATK